jgi:hypothetical protein
MKCGYVGGKYMHFMTANIGIRVCHMLSSPTTITIRRVWRWRRSRCYVVVGAELCCFGVRLENRRFLDLTYCNKPRNKFVWLERIYEFHSQGRRVMPIIGEESWALKLHIFCTSRCHLWVVCAILCTSRSHLDLLDCSRLRRRDVK